jgi:hypothetical protein
MTTKIFRSLCGLTVLSFALYAPSVLADEVQKKKTTTEETTVSTTNSSGTISTFGPDQIVIRTTTSSMPITYQSNTSTTFVDEQGNPVDVAEIQAGVPVTVYYSKSGDKLVATKVIVKNSTAPAMPRG